MPANKGKPSSVQLDLPDLWISATHRTLDQSDEVNEGSAMMSHCSHDSLDNHKPGLSSYILRTTGAALADSVAATEQLTSINGRH